MWDYIQNKEFSCKEELDANHVGENGGVSFNWRKAIKNSVLAEEKLDDIGHRLENSRIS
jgi:hypothetical protein